MNERSSQCQGKVLQNTAPVFVVGSPRSGTTLLLRVLNDFTPYGSIRDDGLMLRFKDLLQQYGDLSIKKNSLRLISDMLSSHEYRDQSRFTNQELSAEEIHGDVCAPSYAAIVYELYRREVAVHGKTYWIDKTTFYAKRMRDVLAVFPNAKFIHIRRDGRDVALSLFRINFGPKNAYSAAKYWRQYVDAVHQQQEYIPKGQLLEISYEEVLQSPIDSFILLAEFLQLGPRFLTRWKCECNEYLKRGNFNKWQNELSDNQVRVFESVAGDTLELAGYETVNDATQRTRLSLPTVAFYRIQDLLLQLQTGENRKPGISKRLQSLIIKLRSLFYAADSH